MSWFLFITVATIHVILEIIISFLIAGGRTEDDAAKIHERHE
jgi:hypothetical protein